MERYKYIGLDSHSSTCTFSVMAETGEEIDNVTLETNGRLLVGYLRGIPGKKKLTFEESELSHWLYEILKDEVDEIIVCNPVANTDYKKAKTDKLDARNLARLLRGNFLTPVFHDGSSREKFRSLMSGYQDLVEEAVRIKNRYKSLFRKDGRAAKGSVLYNDESLLDGFNRDHFKFIGEHAYQLLKQMEESRQKYVEEIKRQSRQFKEIKVLKSMPAIGEIRAAHIVSQVIDPSRFRTKYKYYSYCGLVRHKKISGNKTYGSKKIRGNKVLKCVYKMAAKTALQGDNGLRRYYDSLRARGVSHTAAKNAVSRKIAAISLSLWKNNVRYDDTKVTDGLIKQNSL